MVAYEPVWAIGTGLTPTPGDVAVMHNGDSSAAGRDRRTVALQKCEFSTAVRSSRRTAGRLLTLDNVDGALVGGASLKATDFLAIAAAYR